MHEIKSISILFVLFMLFMPESGQSQTSIADGPVGKKGPCQDLPKLYVPPPPPMQLIPEGWYEMGDHAGIGYAPERPVHAVYIDAFYMDTFEVTNEEYCAYLNSAYLQGQITVYLGVVYNYWGGLPYCDTTYGANYYSSISYDNGSTFSVTQGREDHPMVLVSWYGAAAYANWRSVQDGFTPCYNLTTWECDFSKTGYRLPTEAEWEKAARGGEHNPYYLYPWGNTIDGSMANFENSGDPYEGSGYTDTTPVGYYDGNQIPSGVNMANGYGLYDMAGNIWTWCNDWFDYHYYQYCVDNGIYDNPKGPASGFYRIYRGGGWGNFDLNYLRCARRAAQVPEYRGYSIGIRLVRRAIT